MLAVLDHEAAVLDEVESRVLCYLAGFAAGDSALKPDRFGPRRHGVPGDVGAKLRPPEDVNQIDLPGHLGQ